jgi:mannose-1-phosphate guanylyltransferase/mannose-6-phosphate isomerase
MVACLKAIKLHKNEKITLLILSSDHLISPKNLFEKSILNATEVSKEKIVTFGVEPDFAATGYGYIKKSQNISEHCFAIEKFIEKPDEKKAKKLLDEGGYLWNAGIFLLSADIYLKEAEKYLPKNVDVAKKALANAKEDGAFCTINLSDYQAAQDISIDYGILEKSSAVATTILQADWSDVGDFSAIYKEGVKDKNNNVTDGNVELYDTKDCLIHSHHSLITCLGLKNTIVIETDDTILIADKSKSQDVKLIVKDLLEKNKNEVKLHNRVYRPWGYYETISQDKVFKVKRIAVNPGASLSLQMHNHRSEHWVVIKGVANVQKDEEIFNLEAGKSTFIPVRTKHRLANNSKELLEIVEVQMGDYVEEDDIIRYQDNYGRT